MVQVSQREIPPAMLQSFQIRNQFQSENMEHIRGIGFDYNNLPGLYGWEF